MCLAKVSTLACSLSGKNFSRPSPCEPAVIDSPLVAALHEQGTKAGEAT